MHSKPSPLDFKEVGALGGRARRKYKGVGEVHHTKTGRSFNKRQSASLLDSMVEEEKPKVKKIA